MHILLVAATPFEIQPTIDGLTKSVGRPGQSGQAGRPGESGQPSHSICTLITGIGSMATTWSLMRQIDRARPDLIVQAGIAGCFSQRQPGEVFVISEEVPADLGVWEEGHFKSLFDLKLAGAGLHFVGLQEKIPFLQLRAVSNDIGVRDKTKWNIRLAIDRLNGELNSLLEKLAGKDETLFDCR